MNEERLSRRMLLIAGGMCIVLIVGLVAGYYLGIASVPTPVKETLVVSGAGGTWEDNWIKSFGEPFMEMYPNIEVRFMPGAPSDFYAKLLVAGGVNPPYDLTNCGSGEECYYIENWEKLLEPITSEECPNIKDLYPALWETKPFYKVEPDKYLFGMVSVAPLGIGYRTDLAPYKPMSIKQILTDEAWKGHVAWPVLTYCAGQQLFIMLIHELGGVETNPTDVDKAFQFIKEHKDWLVSFPTSGAGLESVLETAEAWACPIWLGRIISLQDRGVKVGMVVPEFTVPEYTLYGICKGTKHLESAKKLFNFLMSAEGQKNWATHMGYPVMNSKVTMPAEWHERQGFTISNEVLLKWTWIDTVYVKSVMEEWIAKWSEVFA